MKPYPKYKDSGVQWIGLIPETWEISRIKHCGEVFGRIGFRGYTVSDMVSAGEGAIALSPSNIKDNRMSYDKLSYVSWAKYEESPEIQIHNGEILMTKTGSSYGKSAYVEALPMEATINPQFIVIKNIKENAKFLSYVLTTSIIQRQVEDVVVGGTIPTLAQKDINNFYLPLPPLKEQQAIVAYLDDKTSKMDECIRLLELQKADLIDYQHCMLIEIVTRGIKGVSNIELWDKLPLRHVCEFRNGYTPSKTIHEYWENGTIPWYRMDDIRENGRKLNTAKQYITLEAVKGGGLFEAGSFILATTATIGEHALLIADSLANQRFTNLKIRKSLEEKLLREFFFYYLFYIDDVCKTITRISTFPAVDMEKLRSIMVCIPPLSEQHVIVDYLDTKTAKIDETIRRIDEQIADLRAYRSALISDVVTGKIDVRI